MPPTGGDRTGHADGEPELENVKQVQRNEEKDGRGDGDHSRALELEAPPDELSARSQCHKEAGNRPEGDQHSRGKEQPMPQGASPPLTRGADKGENFQRNHGKHARHEVQDQAADKGERKGYQEALHPRAGRLSRSRRGARHWRVDIDPPGSGLVLDDKDAMNARRVRPLCELHVD